MSSDASIGSLFLPVCRGRLVSHFPAEKFTLNYNIVYIKVGWITLQDIYEKY